MKACNKDCLNCTLETCKYDTEVDGVKHFINGKTQGIGQRIKLAMIKRHMRQKALAADTGISECTISAYVKETRRPRADHIVVMCKTLGISADWLLGMEDNNGN